MLHRAVAAGSFPGCPAAETSAALYPGWLGFTQAGLDEAPAAPRLAPGCPKAAREPHTIALGSPVFPKAVVHLGSGSTLTINAPNARDAAPYIQSIDRQRDGVEQGLPGLLHAVSRARR